MSAQIAQQQFNFQYNAPTLTVPPIEENSILIQNLNSYVTESMLHSKFSEVGDIKLISLKSNQLNGVPLGRALIEFKSLDSVKDAIRKFNMKKFFESSEDAEQKFMEVTRKVSKPKLDELKNSCKLFFKITYDSENTIIDPAVISDYLTIYGEIQQIKFKSSKGKLLDYGNIIFKNKEDKEKILKSQEEKNIGDQGFTIQFGDYTQNQQNYNLHVTEHNLINQTISDAILNDKSKLEKERVRLEEIIKKDLEQKKIEYQNISLKVSDVHKKAYFFISLKSKESFEQLENDLTSHKANFTILKKGKDASEQYKNLHLKNLKSEILPEDQQNKIIEDFQKQNPNLQKDHKIILQEESEAKLKQRIQRDLEALGYKDVSIKISTPAVNTKILQSPQGPVKEFPETRQGTLFFSKSEDGIKFMTTYLSKPTVENIRTWFYNNNPQGKVNILLGSADYFQYKKSKLKGASEQYQAYQKQQTQQFLQQQIIDQSQQFNQNINNNSQASAHNYQSFNSRQNSNFQQQQFPNQQNSTYQNNGQRNPTYPNNQGRQYNNNNNNLRSGPGQRFQNNQGQGYQGQRQFTPNYNNGGAPTQNRNPSQGTRQYNNYPNNQQAGQQIQGQFPGVQQQQQQYQQPRQQQNSNPAGGQPKQIQNIPQQINQNNIQQQSVQAPAVMTIDQIRENPDDFVKKPQDLQKSILGQLIYPKVKAKLDERKEESKILTPKITGMLIDFSVFELEDIIEMIDNQEDLNERIEEALELIKNTANQK